jgi:hypothetical protein
VSMYLCANRRFCVHGLLVFFPGGFSNLLTIYFLCGRTLDWAATIVVTGGHILWGGWCPPLVVTGLVRCSGRHCRADGQFIASKHFVLAVRAFVFTRVCMWKAEVYPFLQHLFNTIFVFLSFHCTQFAFLFLLQRRVPADFR